MSRPSLTKTVIQSWRGHIQLFRPLDDVLRFPVVREPAIRATIVALFFMSNPAAIVRRVMTFILFAIQRQAFGDLTIGINRQHPSVERWKRLPFIADGDAAPAPPLIMRIVGVVTATKHVTPEKIKLCSGHAVNVSSISHSGSIA